MRPRSTLTVSNNVNHTKDQPVLGPHRDVTSVSVSGDRGLGCGVRQEFVHLPNATDFFARGIDGEDKDEDDREEHGGVGAMFAKNGSFGCRLRENGDVLVTEKGGTHTTDHDVNGHTDRDQETRGDGVHSREVGDGRRTAQDKHGRDDDVRGQSEGCH